LKKDKMGPRMGIFGVFGRVERRKARQPIGFSDAGRIEVASAVPRVFWQRSFGRWVRNGDPQDGSRIRGAIA
jgi:hypothetical protein